MKNSAAGVATAAAIGLVALTAAPAAAAPGDPMVFTDCATAAGYGVHNIPVGSVSHSSSLVDDDGDGVVCESAEWAYDPTRIPVENESGGYTHTVVDWVPGAGPGPDAQPGEVPGVDPYTQVDEVPVGGADTGAAADSGSGGPVLAGGLALVAAAAAVAVRRRGTGRA
ncbi:UNVERIFIED_CONTAM: hypothetical protein RF653_17760 [Kocuria sp. CPCC 205316]|uniref:hypothetical protein n=1 Tax=Kocuria TaxID=57493 RepID=UPI0036D79577